MLSKSENCCIKSNTCSFSYERYTYKAVEIKKLYNRNKSMNQSNNPVFSPAGVVVIAMPSSVSAMHV